MMIQRAPAKALQPFIKFVWASDESDAEGAIGVSRERMIPTGSMHIVYRLTEQPIRIFESVDDPHGQTFPFGVVGGLRSRFYIKDVCRPLQTVGAILQPGVSASVFGVPAEELAERHTAIQELWGQSSVDLLEQLQEANTLLERFDRFESFLKTKVPAHSCVHPAVTHALNRLSFTSNIGEVVKETGYSHKHFIDLFRTAIGLSPKLYCRIIRFQEALKRAKEPNVSWVDIALQAAYSDQAHFNREFGEFTGMSPGEYRNCRSEGHHVPILIKK